MQPTDRNVVHHSNSFPAGPFGSRRRDRFPRRFAGGRTGNTVSSHSYVPGNAVIRLPDDFAKFMPAGSRLRFQIHYTPYGTATTDQMRLGLVFAKKRPQNVVQVKGSVNTKLNIPPGDDNHAEVAQLPVVHRREDHGVHAAQPSARESVSIRGGVAGQTPTQVLLDIPRYDPEWQLTYRLAEPTELPKGTVLRAHRLVRQQPQQSRQPGPRQNGPLGPQSEDEMLIGFIEYYPAKGRRTREKAANHSAPPPCRKGGS